MGGGRVIEENTILKHSNNFRLWKSGQFTEVVRLQRGSVWGFDYIQLSYILYRPYLAMMHFVTKYTFPKYSNSSIYIVCTNLCCFNLSYLYKYLWIHGKCNTCSPFLYGDYWSPKCLNKLTSYNVIKGCCTFSFQENTIKRVWFLQSNI